MTLRVAVIGSGISGLSAAWLLSRRHAVTVFESADRLGGHSHTVDVPAGCGTIPVDTGFIVYNEATYPNLTALFRHLGVVTAASDMSFAVSLDNGRLEYNGTDLRGLFAQRRNLIRPRFWSMLRDLLRFYRQAPAQAGALGDLSLGDFLQRDGYGRAVREDHLLPMAAAIWSAPASTLLDYPAEAFIRFCDNHGLLKVSDRPAWRTVEGGSINYVRRLADAVSGPIRLGCAVRTVVRDAGGVTVHVTHGETERFDAVVIATHADAALAMLDAPTAVEASLLGTVRYQRNAAVLHSDEAVMPRRRRAWASWNYVGQTTQDGMNADLCVTYWMNRLQPLRSDRAMFVTLNPAVPLDPAKVWHRQTYEHPVFDSGVMRAQKQLWSLQGGANTWFCGAYFGAGFHEDGLQAGLAVAEQLGGEARPWTVPSPSGRIHVAPAPRAEPIAA